MYEPRITNHSLGGGFVSSATTSFLSDESIHHPKDVTRKLLKSRNSVRHKLGLSTEKIPKAITKAETMNFNNDNELKLPGNIEEVSKIPLTAPDSSLIDFSASSSGGGSQGVQAKFIFGDMFFHTAKVITQQSDDSSLSQNSERSSLSNLAQNMSVSIRESSSLVCKNNTVISHESSGTIAIKLQQSQISDSVVRSDLNSADITINAMDSRNAIKSWDISSSLFESLPEVKKRSDNNLYETKLKILGDDAKPLFLYQPLSLYEYKYSVVNEEKTSLLPFRVRNQLSKHDEETDTYSSINFQMWIDVDLSHILSSDQKKDVKLRGTKVQVSFASLLSKITIEDITMQPSGSFDRNKRLVTWLAEDICFDSSTQLVFTASLKYSSEQTNIVESQSLLEKFLPTMLKTQIFELLSGLKFPEVALGVDEKLVNLSKITQVEYKIA